MTTQFVDHTADLEPGPVNLDGMDQSELYTFIAATDPWPKRAAGRLFKGEPNAMRTMRTVRTVRWLCQYARNKVVAMACRERGEVKEALRYENACERYYNDLPEYARW